MSTSVASWRFISRLCNFLINSLEAKVGPGKKKRRDFFPLLSREFFQSEGNYIFPIISHRECGGKKRRGGESIFFFFFSVVCISHPPKETRSSSGPCSKFSNFGDTLPSLKTTREEKKNRHYAFLSFFHAWVWVWDETGPKKPSFFLSSSLNRFGFQCQRREFFYGNAQGFFRGKKYRILFFCSILVCDRRKIFCKTWATFRTQPMPRAFLFPWQRPLLIRETVFGQHNS